jgi:[ribosomal protein S5]-alanine N-acetyltransferase
MITLQTDRLLLRTFQLEDASGLLALNADPIVLQYTGDLPFLNLKEAENFVLNYTHYQDYGLGRWSVLDRYTNEFIGWCGLKYSPEKNEYDLGFRLLQQHWNKGYATEASLASLRYGFQNLGLLEIVGRARIENKASIAVLKKVGMLEEKAFDFDGHPGVQFKIDANSFMKQLNLVKSK